LQNKNPSISDTFSKICCVLSKAATNVLQAAEGTTILPHALETYCHTPIKCLQTQHNHFDHIQDNSMYLMVKLLIDLIFFTYSLLEVGQSKTNIEQKLYNKILKEMQSSILKTQWSEVEGKGDDKNHCNHEIHREQIMHI
jgi:hypothetical protein